jgi:4,5-dihydroxyphthalate decarboxylase
MTQVSREDTDIIGLPVICSRLFRFSSFYVNRKSGITAVGDLRGKRVGSPEWAHSAAVYMRGWMQNEMGVQLRDVHWYQAGANAPGREEKVELNLPRV